MEARRPAAPRRPPPRRFIIIEQVRADAAEEVLAGVRVRVDDVDDSVVDALAAAQQVLASAPAPAHIAVRPYASPEKHGLRSATETMGASSTTVAPLTTTTPRECAPACGGAKACVPAIVAISNVLNSMMLRCSSRRRRPTWSAPCWLWCTRLGLPSVRVVAARLCLDIADDNTTLQSVHYTCSPAGAAFASNRMSAC